MLPCSLLFALMNVRREDVDVRMLGSGRPFCIELSRPRCHCRHAALLAHATKTISENSNGLISVHELKFEVEKVVKVRMVRIECID